MSTSINSMAVTVTFGSKANKTWIITESISIIEIARQLRVNEYRKVLYIVIDGQSLTGRQFYSLLRKNGIAYKFDINESISYGNVFRVQENKVNR